MIYRGLDGLHGLHCLALSYRAALCRSMVVAVLTVTVSGCTVTPGSNMSREYFPETAEAGEYHDIFGVPLGRKLPSTGIEARQVLITPTLNAELAAARAAETDLALPTKPDAADPLTGPYEYRVGNGDVLSIVVWDHPELTAPFGSFNNAREQGNVVREDGTIYYPFVGSVRAEGRTAREIRDELAVRLAEFIESPQLDVRVAGYRSQRFFVAGAVTQPGTFPVTDIPLTLVDAINLAGGLDESADLFDVRLTRGEVSTTVPLYEILFEGEVAHNYRIRHGDVVHVAPNERRQVFVLGEVVKPQSLPVTNRPLSLTQALATVGGIQESRADGRGVYVIRAADSSDSVDVYRLDVSQAWALALGDQFMLQPRDVVYVSAAPITRWNRWVSNVLPSLQGLFNIDRLGNN
jgi:polysaccharide export outer membrane protein